MIKERRPMAMTPEKKVKNAVVKQLKELGAYYLFPATGGYGTSGHPDIVGCYGGKFFGIECKAGKGKTTALQDLRLREITAAGGLGWVVNEENMDAVGIMFKKFL
jgi:Holliday junction resolvase